MTSSTLRTALRIHSTAACVALSLLTGCGGGGGEGDDPPPPPAATTPPPSASPPPPGGAASVAPTISSQPVNVTVAEGAAATFTVVADGTAPLTYQWRRNGGDIAGAGEANYSFTATASDDGASFDVVITNAAGSVTSAAATLTLETPVATTPPLPANDSIAIHLDDDIYVVRIDGSNLRAVTNAPGEERFLAVTPDGHLIYRYIAGPGSSHELRSVWLDGSHDTLLAAGDVEYQGITDDGRVIFHEHTAATASDIIIVNADGTGRLPLAVTADGETYLAHHQSGTTQRVIYRREPADGGGPDLHSVNLDGSADVALTATPEYDHLLDVADDRVFYEHLVGTQHVISSVAISGGTGQILTEAGIYGGLMTVAGETRVLYRQEGVLFSTDLIGNDRIVLADAPPTGWQDQAFHPTPDGRVVFSREPQVVYGFQRDLYVAAADGASLVQLTDTPNHIERFEALSESGRVVYSAQLSGTAAQGELYSVLLDGSDPRVLSEAPQDEVVVGHAPDDRIVFRRMMPAAVGSQGDLYTVNPDGSGLAVLAATEEYEVLLGFATPLSGGTQAGGTQAGGTRAIYWSDDGAADGVDVYSVNLDGSDAILIATNAALHVYSGVF